MVIGLTGGIASGKTTASKILKELGAIIVDADEIAHQVYRPGETAYQAIIEEFGKEMIGEDGRIDRDRLGEVVFGDERARKRLEEITHPLIIEEIKDRLDGYRDQGERAIFLVAPLLYEVGLDRLTAEVWVVYVDYRTQLQRLMSRDKLDREQARQRINAQLSLEQKREKADRVIDNRGNLQDLKNQLTELYNLYFGD